MEGFILEVNSWEVLKVVPYSAFLMLTLTWGIDMLFEKFTLKMGGGVKFENILVSLISLVVTSNLMP